MGVYGINQGDLALNSGNYDLSYQGNNLTITKALLTRDPDLGKVVLYQLSYSRVTTCCPFGRNRTFDA